MAPRPRLTEDRVRAVVPHEDGYNCNKITKRMKVTLFRRLLGSTG